MKAIAISDISGTTMWTTEPSSWHYSTKRSQQDIFRPVNLPNDNRFKSRSKVCRSLFGPSDPNESQRLAYEELNSRRFGDRNRWNFDFHQEKPISGRYDWHKIRSSTSSTTSNENNHNKDQQQSKYNTGDHPNNSLWSSRKSPSKSYYGAEGAANGNLKMKHKLG